MRLRLALANNLPQKSLQSPHINMLEPFLANAGIYVEFVAKPIELINASSRREPHVEIPWTPAP